MIFKALLQPGIWGHSVPPSPASHLPAPLLSSALHYTYSFFCPPHTPLNLPSFSSYSFSIIPFFFHLTLYFSPPLLPSIFTSSGHITSHLILAPSLLCASPLLSHPPSFLQQTTVSRSSMSLNLFAFFFFSPLVSTLHMLWMHLLCMHTFLHLHVSGFPSVLLWSRCMPNRLSCSQKARSVFTH